MVAFTNLVCLYTAFDMLTGLFDRVVPQKKFHKAVGMVCQPFRAVGVWLDKAYKRRMTREGRSYKETQ